MSIWIPALHAGMTQSHGVPTLTESFQFSKEHTKQERGSYDDSPIFVSFVSSR
jgi:hypothetical protein